MNKSVIERNLNLLNYLRQHKIIDEGTLLQCLKKCNEQGMELGSVLVQHRLITIKALSDFMKSTSPGLKTGVHSNSENQGVLGEMPGNIAKNFGKYTILGEIARGGMGVVYRAQSEGDKRIVALKILMAKSEFQGRFLREAKACATLQHNNIIPVYDMGVHENIYYFTMKYIEGFTLNDIFKEEEYLQKDTKRAIKMIITIAKALHYAHENNIIHRDLKPSNILIDKEDTPYIADFGLAKMVDTNSQLTQSGEVLGTPFFMPPEQASGKKTDKRSDIYSLGVILYQALTGEFPFYDTNFPGLYNKIMTQDPVPPREYNPQVNRDLEYVCLKSIEKEPELRYQTAKAFYQDLQKAFQGKNLKNQQAKNRSKKIYHKTKKNIGLIGFLFVSFALIMIAVYYKDSLMIKNKDTIISQKFALYDSYMTQHKYGQALAIIEEVLKEIPDLAEGYSKRARVHYLNQNISEAFTDITKSTELSPLYENLILKGNWLEEQSLYKQALHAYKVAEEKAQNKTELKTAQIKIANLQLLDKNPGASLEIFEKLSQEYSEDTTILFGLAKSYNENNNEKEAQHYFQLCVTSIDANIKSQSYYYLGILAKKQESTASAIKNFKLSLANNYPNQEELCIILGELFLQEQKYVEAISYSEKALQISPNNIRTHIFSAEAHYALENFEKAITHYNECIDAFPWKSSFYFQRGNCFSKIKDYTASARDLLRACELEPSNLKSLERIYLDLVYYPSLEESMEMEKTISRALLLMFRHVEIDLFQPEKVALAEKCILEYSAIEKKNTSFSEAEIAKFIDIIAHSKSEETKEIAKAALSKLYQNRISVEQIKKYINRFESSTKENLNTFYEQIWSKHIDFQKVHMRQLLARYYVLKDINAFHELSESPFMVELLTSILEYDYSDVIRFWTANILIEMGTPELYQLIFKYTESHDLNLQILSLSALRANNIAVQYEPLATPKSIFFRYLLVEYLLKESTQALLYTKDKEERIKLLAASRLWQDGIRSAEQIFIDSFSSPDVLLRSYAIEMFWNFERGNQQKKKWEPEITKKYSSYLYAAVSDSSTFVQRITILRMSLLQKIKIIETIKPKLESQDDFVVLQALTAIGMHGDIELVTSFLKDSQKTYLQAVIYIISEMAPDSNLKNLSMLSVVNDTMKHHDAKLRFMFLSIIGRIKNIGAKYVFNYLDDPDYYTRLGAIFSLHQQGSLDMIPRLEQFLKSDDDREAGTAAFTIITIILAHNNPKLLEKYHEIIKKRNVNEDASYAYARKLRSMGDYGNLVIQHRTTNKKEIYPFYLKKIYNTLEVVKINQNDLFLQYIEQMQSAVELVPNNDNYLAQMSIIYYANGQYNKALDFIEKSILVNDDITYYYWLAYIHARLNNETKALEAIDKYLSYYFKDIEGVTLQLFLCKKLGKTDEARYIKEKLAILKLISKN